MMLLLSTCLAWCGSWRCKATNMVTTVAYKPQLHQHLLEQWCTMRNKVLAPQLLPQLGFVAYIDDEPIATLFISSYSDVPVVAFDNLFSNPKAGFKVVRALKSLYRVCKDFVYHVAELSSAPQPIIQCRIDAKIVHVLQKRYPEWHVSDADYKLCYILPNNNK